MSPVRLLCTRWILSEYLLLMSPNFNAFSWHREKTFRLNHHITQIPERIKMYKNSIGSCWCKLLWIVRLARLVSKFVHNQDFHLTETEVRKTASVLQIPLQKFSFWLNLQNILRSDLKILTNLLSFMKKEYLWSTWPKIPSVRFTYFFFSRLWGYCWRVL